MVGPPDRCIAKLSELSSLGIDKVLLSGQFNENVYGSEEDTTARRLMEAEVLPVMQAG